MDTDNTSILLYEELYKYIDSCLQEPNLGMYKAAIESAFLLGFQMFDDVKHLIQEKKDLALMHKKFIALHHKYLKEEIDDNSKNNVSLNIAHEKDLKNLYHKHIINSKNNKGLKRPQKSKLREIENLSLKLFGWSRGRDALKRFHEILVELHWIDCTFEKFEYHFYGKHLHLEQIIWLSSGKILARLFFILRQIGIIPSAKEKAILLRKHFRSEFGQFEEDTLRKNPGKPLDDNNELIIKEIIRKIENG
ncbi:MAG TPA: hypothetical protein VFW78_02730 [Bacteroidia bacterium]|nr:hypothetical protein [Bacteroidia bacterium]